MANRSNKLVVPGAENILNKMKLEIAAELGLGDYDKIDKGALPSRINGMVGGTMTKRLIEIAQQHLASQGNQNTVQGTNLNFDEYKKEAVQDLNNTLQ